MEMKLLKYSTAFCMLILIVVFAYLQLVIHKRESGFGFTLSGSNPVHVDKIESGKCMVLSFCSL